MKYSVKIILALLSLAALTLVSCNTMAGVGHDLQQAGGAISNKADQ